MTTTLNGNAEIIAADCSAFKPVSPPAKSNTYAIDDNNNPQINFTKFAGLKVPKAVCIPKTNVAESAEVIKKEDISPTVKIDKTKLIGSSLKIPNNCVSGGISNICDVLCA